MPSLKQRIEASAQSLVLDLLDLIRTTPLAELGKLSTPDPQHAPEPKAAPPRAKKKAPRRTKEQREPRPKPPEPKPRRAARGRKAAAREAPQGAFDVTAPELLLEAPPIAGPGESVPPTDGDKKTQPEPPAAASPPAEAPPVPALRPGESLARASSAGIVIRRERRSP